MSPSDTPVPSGRPVSAPPPLVVACALVGLEALALVGYGLVLIPAVDKQRLVMGVTTPLFFVLYGVGLALLGWQLWKLHSWARAPIVLAQLIQLGVAWSFRGGSSTAVAVVLALLAFLTLAGIFHPASIAVLGDEQD